MVTVHIIDDDNNSGDETTEDNDNEDDNNGDGNGNDDDTGNNGGNGGNYPNTNTDGGTDGNYEDGEENNVGDVGDPGLPKISIADTTVEEGDTARFVVTLSPASDQTVTVRYKTADGTADEGTDYRGVSRTLTFVPDDTEQTILVWSHEDDVDDPNETFTAELSNPIGATLEDGSATGTIIEYDESVPQPKLSIVDTTVVEGGTAQFTVRLSPASEQTVTVRYRTASETAVAGRDFDTASGTLTFTPGNRRQSIAVPTREDDLDEPNETFTVRLNNAIGATLEDGSATGTIVDDDVSVSVPPPTLSIVDATVVEGETARFAVRLSPASEQTVTVSYRTVGGTAAAGQDFDAASGTLTFAPGNRRQSIAVPTRDDALDEPDETFLVTLSNPSGATLEDGSATGTIIDDDVPVPPPTLSIADATVVEGETARFAVGLSRASEQTVTVRYRTAGGTATEGTDYDRASGTHTFAPGETEKTILVQTHEDALDEPDETLFVELSNPIGATLEDGSATGTIIEYDESVPLPKLSIADTTAVEGETARFTVRLSPAREQTVTVSYRTASGTAVAGRDFDTAFGTLTFAPGNRRQSIAVPTREDDLDEPNETFTVRLNNAIGATLEDASATGAIVDDDVPVPPPTLSIADATVVEGETARFAVRLSPASEQTVTVSYRTVGGTAAAGQDFDAASGTLTFAPGNTRQSIAVPTRDDALDEPDETFLVTLSNPSGATLEDGSATGTIIDDDVPVPPPTLSIADATVVEGETARFAVGLSRASEQTVTVSYRTAGGTAAAGRDFDAVFGTLTFGPRTTQQVIAVPTREDKLDEPDETFLVTLSNPNGATIQDGTATGTIADDDVRSLAPINRELLPEIGRALAFTAVRCRIEQAFSDMARGWAEPVVSPSLSVPPISSGLADGDGGSLELEDILANTSFLLPLMGGNGGTIQFSTWGCGDYRSLAGDGGGDAGAWDGEAFSVQVGADAIVGRDLLAGVSLSQSRGSLDFDGPGGSDPAGGRYDLGLTGVHPYLGWWISPDLELWGTFGLAGGDLQVVDDAAGSSATSAATLASATVGINGRLMTYGAATLRLKGEGSLAQLDVSKSGGLFQGASANLQRLRLAAEVEYEHVIPDVGVLVPWGELGLRHEGGDGATGSSLELGGGLHYRNIEQGWNAEVYGRWLAVQDDAPLQEQGFGLRFRYDPETPGFGPWVSLTQTWGEPASSVHRLWSDGTNRLAVHDSSERRLDLEVGYGFPAFGGRAALAPYGAVSLENSDARGYRLGMRVSLGSSGLLSLETERRERPAASADHRIMLRAIARF